jgi:hypothetical protein
MNKKANKNGCSIGGDPIRHHSAPAQSGQPEGVGKASLKSYSPIWIAPGRSTAAKYSTPQ